MDVRLADLDALALSVRDPRARAQIREAITAYRAGASRAAIIATWVAVALDILAKIEEVAQNGDGAGQEFIASFERARASNNIPQLQKLESDLLNQAQGKFAFFGTIEADLLQRIAADRNRCAHPTFVADDELFQPSGDLVRSHIVHAITLLLVLPPTQGRALIEAFARELDVPAFPKEHESAKRYVVERYLTKMRPNAVPGFARYVLRQVLDREDRGRYGVQPREAALLSALDAIATVFPELWKRDVQADALRIIDNLEGDRIGRAFLLLAAFPELAVRLDGQQRTRLTVALGHWKRAHGYDVFAAVDVPGFEDATAKAFENIPTQQHVEIARYYPTRHFLKPCLLMLSRANSYNGAEFTLGFRVLPLTTRIEASDVHEILNTLKGNEQAYQAPGVPSILAQMADLMGQRRQLGSSSPWDDLRQFLALHRALHFQVLWDVLAKYGVQTICTSTEAEDRENAIFGTDMMS